MSNAASLQSPLATLAINTLRTLSIDAVQAANSGHPGLPLGCAPMVYVLSQRHLHYDPSAPTWFNRDRFVLSAGHGSALLYSLLHLTGYDLGLEELKQFRQWGSRTPGHPEWHDTPGVEATTGPLGQGAANAVGMALAERYLGRLFNRPGHTLIDHTTYALVSDGDVMEGVACEAASLAGHLGLGKLIYLYDANEVTLDGPLSLIMSEDVGARYAACGWHVQHVADGNADLAAIDAALTAAKAETSRPSLIVVRTTIGFGSPK
jgi:transketolase